MKVFYCPNTGAFSVDAPTDDLEKSTDLPDAFRSQVVVVKMPGGAFEVMLAQAATQYRVEQYTPIDLDRTLIPEASGALVLPSGVWLPRFGFAGPSTLRTGADGNSYRTGPLPGVYVGTAGTGKVGKDQVRLRTQAGRICRVPKTAMAPSYYPMDAETADTILEKAGRPLRTQIAHAIVSGEDANSLIYKFGRRPEILAAVLWRRVSPIVQRIPCVPKPHPSHKHILPGGFCRDCGLLNLREKCKPFETGKGGKK